jgi:hypothetical protein
MGMVDDLHTRNMFFFGTLMDVDMLSMVLGRIPASADREAAFLRGLRRVFIVNRPYPMLVQQTGGRVEGLLVSGLGERDMERLAYYEGWEYVTEPVTVRTLAGRSVETEMFSASSGVLPELRDWKLDFWQRKHKPEALVQASETMARLGRF